MDADIAREIGVGQRASYGPHDDLIALREEEFIKILSGILGSEKTRHVIRGILSHAIDQGLEEDIPF